MFVDGMASIKSRKRERERIKSDFWFDISCLYDSEKDGWAFLCVCVHHTSQAEALKTLLVTVLDG